MKPNSANYKPPQQNQQIKRAPPKQTVGANVGAMILAALAATVGGVR